MTDGDRAPGRRRRPCSATAVVAALLILVAVLGVVGVELAGRRMIESTAADMLAEQGVADASVRLGGDWWRPVIFTALLDGTVEEVTVDLSGIDVAGVQVARARYVLEDLEVAPDLRAKSLRVSAIRRGSFRLLLSPDAVGEELGVEARIVDDRLVVGPDDEPAKLRVDGEELVLESPYLQRMGHPPRMAALSARLLPCPPETAIVDGYIALLCSGSDLPAVLDQSLGEPVADMPAPPELEPPVTAERDHGD